MSDNVRKDAKAIAMAALATGSTIEVAAAQAKVSTRTVDRWLASDPAFRAGIRRLRDMAIDSAVGAMSSSLNAAVATLRRNLTCKHAGTQVRAAVALIEQLLRIREQTDLAGRIAEIERQLAAEESSGSGIDK